MIEFQSGEVKELSVELNPLSTGDWTEGITVRKIVVIPSTAYVGETIEIKVYIDYPYPLPPLPMEVKGTVYINGITLSEQWTMETYDTTLVFKYYAAIAGEFTIQAQDKLANLTVLSDITSTYYMPWGGVRMPVCTEWSNGECLAWNPVDATVSTYVVREGWWTGQLLAMAVDYTCKEYWDTKDELACVIARSLGYNRVPPLEEWVLQYGTVCPVCDGTGQVICTREMHRHCRPGEVIECPECNGIGKVLRVDLERGWRDWQKELEYHSVCGAGSCTPSIRCPYCDQKIYGPSHTRGSSWDKESFARQVLSHIENIHPNHPLTEPAWF